MGCVCVCVCVQLDKINKSIKCNTFYVTSLPLCNTIKKTPYPASKHFHHQTPTTPFRQLDIRMQPKVYMHCLRITACFTPTLC